MILLKHIANLFYKFLRTRGGFQRQAVIKTDATRSRISAEKRPVKLQIANDFRYMPWNHDHLDHQDVYVNHKFIVSQILFLNLYSLPVYYDRLFKA